MSEVKEEIKEAPDGTLEQGEFKVKKKKPKKLTTKKRSTTKVDLSKKPESKKEEENAVLKQATKEDVSPTSGESKETREETKVELQEVGGTHSEEQTTSVENKEKEEVVLEEVTKEEVKEDKPILEQPSTNTPVNDQENSIPESVHKLLDFMEDTGGNLEDFVRLSKDYSNVDESILLREYYKNIRPHLDNEEVDFILEDTFSWDEDVDDERTIRKKKLAYKEEIAKAKNFLDDLKGKYYEEIKLRPGVTQEQQKAMDFFNRYNKEQTAIKQQHDMFKNTTKNYFTNEFEGFNFDVGDKTFRYKVNNPNDVAESQSNLTNFVKKFLDEKGNVKDYKGYHKAIYAARNADTIANHFYEQGKTDAVKDMMAKSKNINNDPRPSGDGEVFINGLKVRAISGVDSSKLKIKTRNK